MRLGVLDLGRELEGSDSAERVQQTIELARLAEENGFSRYWVAEHHVEGTTLAAPEVILGVVAASTMTIRVGSGGVLLRYYSPLKVAEVYLTLAAAFPGRVELGVCRGPGVPDERTALALVSDNVAELTDENYALKLDELFAFLDRNGSSRIPRARPRDVATPPVWVLGSGSRSVEQAVQHRSRYGFMCFFPGSEQLGPQLVGQYLADVRAPEDEGPLIAVTVVCAETDKKARRLHDSLLASGYLASNVVGDRRHCVRALEEMAASFGAKDVLVACSSPRFTDQRNLISLLGPASA
ncbi:MAG: MsnO8 family LLM class oxidoreductase [Solirubrobacteraceae bacterium]